METADKLKQSFSACGYKLANHGDRTVSILKEALDGVPGSMESDVYGTGEVIEQFQKKMADYLGKEDAVFFPSGTMAQQIGLRIWADQKHTHNVAYHPLSHLEIHEEDGLKELHHLEPLLLGAEDRLITLEDVKGLDSSVGCLLLELPQREIGGQLPTFEELERISEYCKTTGIKLHLDGARLWECLPYYQKSAADICALFDSVYVSFYKGLGGVAGAILAGDRSFIDESKVWKRRHGGDLISLYPYILSADYYFDKRIQQMSMYHEEACQAAERFNRCADVATNPQVPVTNMFHVHIARSKEEVSALLQQLQQELGVGLTGNLVERGPNSCSFELSFGDAYRKIPTELLDRTFEELDNKLKKR